MLKIYLFSVVLSFLVSYISTKATYNKCKREDYKTIKTKSSIAEKLKIGIYFFIPIFNILLMLIILFTEDTLIENLKNKGILVKEN